MSSPQSHSHSLFGIDLCPLLLSDSVSSFHLLWLWPGWGRVTRAEVSVQAWQFLVPSYGSWSLPCQLPMLLSSHLVLVLMITLLCVLLGPGQLGGRKDACIFTLVQCIVGGSASVEAPEKYMVLKSIGFCFLLTWKTSQVAVTSPFGLCQGYTPHSLLETSLVAPVPHINFQFH